jgi:hypothetical protein
LVDEETVEFSDLFDPFDVTTGAGGGLQPGP